VRPIATFLSIVTLSSTLGAKAPPVALGEVSTRLAKSDPTLDRAFRSAVEVELDALDFSDVRPAERYVLSASLLEVTTRASDGRNESTAVVSATLRRAKGGTLHAILRGRAQAVDGPKDKKSLEQSAIRGAVHSALGRVPQALK